MKLKKLQKRNAMKSNNQNYRYISLVNSVEGEDLVNSEDQYLFFCWEPNFSLPVLTSRLKFRKHVSTFIVAGCFFLMPKLSFAKDVPKSVPSNNNSGIVIYSDGKPEAIMFDPSKKDLALAVISQKKSIPFEKNLNLSVVPYTPPASVISVPKTTQGVMVPKIPDSRASKAMVISKRPQSRKMVIRGRRNRRVKCYTVYGNSMYENSLLSAKRVNNMSLSLKEMQDALANEYPVEFPYLVGGDNPSEMSLAQKEEQIRYYRFISRVVLFGSGVAMFVLAFNFYLYVKKSHRTFDKLLSKYLLNKSKNVESAKLYTELFTKWKSMVTDYSKTLKDKNAEIKKIRNISASEIATLHLLIDMLTEDRDGLLKELKFLKEHGNP